MLLKFTKMHSLGNDFVIIDLITQRFKLHSAHIRRIADRHIGIGCDQVIVIEPPVRRDSDFYYRNYNADGHEVEQCGNGARCAAKFVLDAGLANKHKLYADCLSGCMSFVIKGKNHVSVNMGKARFLELNKQVNFDGNDLNVHLVSVGNPHVITTVPDIYNYPVGRVGNLISNSDLFSHGANVSFVQKIDDNNFKIRVYERGVGETLACGSAATATIAAMHKLGMSDSKACVHFNLGKLDITINENNSIYLAGPTTSVYTGSCRF